MCVWSVGSRQLQEQLGGELGRVGLREVGARQAGPGRVRHQEPGVLPHRVRQAGPLAFAVSAVPAGSPHSQQEPLREASLPGRRDSGGGGGCRWQRLRPEVRHRLLPDGRPGLPSPCASCRTPAPATSTAPLPASWEAALTVPSACTSPASWASASTRTQHPA